MKLKKKKITFKKKKLTKIKKIYITNKNSQKRAKVLKFFYKLVKLLIRIKKFKVKNKIILIA